MKKYLITIILTLFIASSAFALDLCYTVEEATKADSIAKFVSVHENKETICNPAWIDDGTVCPRVAKYTDEEWLEEFINRYIGNQIDRGGRKSARDTAGQNYTPVKDRVTIKK